MAPCHSCCSNQRVKLQGFRTPAKRKYKIFLLNSIMMQCNKSVTNGCDYPPCQHLIDFTCNLLCDQCSDTMLVYFPFSLTLPWSEELRSWDWIKCYTISLSEIRNLFQKQYHVDLQYLQMEWSDWCYWDVSVVTSLVQFVLHELHPDDIVTFKVIHGEYTIKDNTCFQLKPDV